MIVLFNFLWLEKREQLKEIKCVEQRGNGQVLGTLFTGFSMISLHGKMTICHLDDSWQLVEIASKTSILTFVKHFVEN